MRSIAQDLRYALRQILRSPGFSLTALLSLACGIAATTAVFSVIWAVVVEPFPYAHSDRMAHLALGDFSSGRYQGFDITVPQWEQLRTVPAVEDSILTHYDDLTLTGQDFPEDVQASFMTSNAFQFFGVPAALGRGLEPSDAVGHNEPQAVVVLGYAFWQRRFRGDPHVMGKTLELARKPYTIVGVAAKRFTWNDGDVYLPLKLTAGEEACTVEIRLKPGISHGMAAEEMQPLITQFERQIPQYYPYHPGPLRVIGINEQFMADLGPTLAMLFGAVGLLLAIGCGNVSILLLARGTARQHEFALRTAIGATRGRIVRQLLTESLLLALAGAALGVALSYRLVAIIVGLLPQNAFPHEAAIRISTPALVFCVVVAVLTGILFGLSPALRLSRPDVRDAMQSGARRIAGSAGEKSMHHLLIGGQIALTMILLTTSMVATGSFLKLAHVRLGYDPHHVMSVGIPLRTASYPSAAARAAFTQSLEEKVAAVPGVKMAAVSTNATPPNNGFRGPVAVSGSSVSDQAAILFNLVSPGYFPLLKIPLVRGRIWTEAENRNAAKLCVVNETFVRRYFPQGVAIGHTLRSPQLFAPHPPEIVTAPGADSPLLIIGVVADKLDRGLKQPIEAEAFVPYTLMEGQYTQLLVETEGAPLASVHAVATAVASVDRDQQVAGEVLDLSQWIQQQPEYAQGQLVTWLCGGFAIIALLLAAVGLYSVISYTVVRRTNEFGVRMALGAMRTHVLWLVIRSAAISVGCGVVLGVAGSLAAQHMLTHVIQAGSTGGLWPLAAAVLVLGMAALLASSIPAHRATQIDPLEALRYE